MSRRCNSTTGMAVAALLAVGLVDGAAAIDKAAPVGSSSRCGATAATGVRQPTTAQMVASGLGKLPVAPSARRVDLVAPPFSNPTRVTNPLFPISDLHSVVLNGKVDGKAFRTETTLLDDTRVIEWAPGQCVKTLVSQYLAYLDGRIEEVALDYYAQADDGSVWYFGEDVFNYERGVVADTSGTWLAGKEGPAAMIMPADPEVGDVNRPENIPGLVWEEVTTKTTGKAVKGPLGPVRGAMVATELHDDGSVSDKVFAPRYGEFYTAHEGDVEALAVAVPTDARGSSVPPWLTRMTRAASSAFDAAAARRWRAASRAVAGARTAWRSHPAGDVPRRLISPTDRALQALRRAVEQHSRARALNAALDLTQAALDLQLRYRVPAQIDRARFDLWTRQVQVDARSRELASVRGDVATLEWLRDRFVPALDPVTLTRLDTGLEALRASVTDRELRVASRRAAALRRVR